MLIYEKTNIPPLRFTITLRQLDNLIHQIRNDIYILIVVYEKNLIIISLHCSRVLQYIHS